MGFFFSWAQRWASLASPVTSDCGDLSAWLRPAFPQVAALTHHLLPVLETLGGRRKAFPRHSGLQRTALFLSEPSGSGFGTFPPFPDLPHLRVLLLRGPHTGVSLASPEPPRPGPSGRAAARHAGPARGGRAAAARHAGWKDVEPHGRRARRTSEEARAGRRAFPGAGARAAPWAAPSLGSVLSRVRGGSRRLERRRRSAGEAVCH